MVLSSLSHTHAHAHTSHTHTHAHTHTHTHSHSKIVQEVRALTTLEDVSDDEVFELSTMAGPSHVPSSSTGHTSTLSPEPRWRRFNSLVCETTGLMAHACLSIKLTYRSGQEKDG